MCSRDILHKAKRDQPGKVHSDQMVQDDQAGPGEAGPCYRWLKTNSERLSDVSPHRSDGSRDSQVGGWSVGNHWFGMSLSPWCL